MSVVVALTNKCDGSTTPILVAMSATMRLCLQQRPKATTSIGTVVPYNQVLGSDGSTSALKASGIARVKRERERLDASGSFGGVYFVTLSVETRGAGDGCPQCIDELIGAQSVTAAGAVAAVAAVAAVLNNGGSGAPQALSNACSAG
jgi:NAD(P)H-nitrite reductase large subunit